MLSYAFITAVCCAIDLSATFSVETNYEPGYYWREFNGKIPQDALPGGVNSQGVTTYIGQVFGNNLVIPAKIDIVNDTVTYEWGYQEFVATENIKILCAKYPEEFQWLSTGHGYINQLKGKHLIIGGYESGANIYIGRIQLDDELALGKVINGSNQATLNTTKDGKGTQHAAFQVLSYNPIASTRKQSSDCQVVINVY
ncbi:hypothetical protein PPYR_08703 [Photinus pyralis]|uniref:Uncharacterized protein n=1 Tax=Photinus pyralis TaxID=7054 RepID=A0A1Y1KHX0_PHOPY|nr:uncharacterized protein LOC116171562 [Photinus pyralis]KAB0797710.1 hypothetical protein PPYR_08703 [Photinus pyralis]